MEQKQFTKEEIDTLLADLNRISNNIHRITLRECYIESLLETSGYRYKYEDIYSYKRPRGTFYVEKNNTQLIYQYKNCNRSFAKCIVITKKD